MTTSSGTGTRLRVRTNAKLNLFLRVVGRRPDGFHELESIFHGIGLGDDLEIELSDSGAVEVDMVLAEGLVGDIPTSNENLVAKSIERLVERGARNPGIKVRITKRIPIAAGLGGGSGNAAGTIVAMSEQWGLNLDRQGLLDVAALVGSDVPYCIGGGTMLAMKRGEALTPLPSPEEIWFVLGISFRPVLTKDVYDSWDELEPSDEVGSAPMSFALGTGDIEEIAALLHNDLERAVFRLWPELEEKKEAMVDSGALGASVTGSGPTIFGIARDEKHAQRIAAEVESYFDRVLVVASTPRCVERLD